MSGPLAFVWPELRVARGGLSIRIFRGTSPAAAAEYDSCLSVDAQGGGELGGYSGWFEASGWRAPEEITGWGLRNRKLMLGFAPLR